MSSDLDMLNFRGLWDTQSPWIFRAANGKLKLRRNERKGKRKVIDAKIVEFRKETTRDKGKILLSLFPTGTSTSTDTNALEGFLLTAFLFDLKVKLRPWPAPLNIGSW